MKKALDENGLIQPLKNGLKDYLKDESRISGKACSISFPENESEIQAIIQTLLRQNIPITVQGSRTGITGGAVPVKGHILNLSKMTGVTGLERDQDGNFAIRVQPGISLSELDQQLYNCRFDSDGWGQKSLRALAALKKSGRHFWPPDPSEKSASIGGVAASNSSGICTFHYGPVRCHIKRIRVADTNGKIHSITRGQYVFSQGFCPLPGGSHIRLDTTALEEESPDNPLYPYDLMDLYLGSQGMFGVITELVLSLQPLPREVWGIVFFFQAQSRAVSFIQAFHQRQKTEPGADIAAIEFMDQTTLECIREYKKMNSGLAALPDLDPMSASAVCMEIHSNSTEAIEALSESLLETATECGGDPDSTWAFCGEIEIERHRSFRNAAMESVHLIIDRARQKDSRITPLGMDLHIQKDYLSKVLESCQQDLHDHELKAAVFGHAGDGYFHVNLLPQDYPQFDRGQTLIEEWAKNIMPGQGSVAKVHGAGKIKKGLFQSIPLPHRLKVIRSIKQQLDPDELWNPGNMPGFPRDKKTINYNGNPSND